MLRRSLFLLLLLVLVPQLRSQCTNLSSACTGGSSMLCESPPRIGTAWVLRAAIACPPGPNAMLFGTCANPAGLGALACTTCATCALWITPIQSVVVWPGTFVLSVPIPADPALVGARFCVQNACAPGATCVCLANAMQVTVQR